MSLSKQQAEFAADVARLILHINEAGYTCTFGEAWRPAVTAEYYAKAGIGTKDSLHLERLAIDLNLFRNGSWLSSTEAHRQFGEYWESLSPLNRWGGRFAKPDGNHYERRKA